MIGKCVIREIYTSNFITKEVGNSMIAGDRCTHIRVQSTTVVVNSNLNLMKQDPSVNSNLDAP